MIVVRYAALAALVIWLGALQGALVVGAWPHFAGIELACACVLVLTLLTMKFMGPPPRAFVVRLLIAVTMLIVGAFDWQYGASPPKAALNAALGFGLLVWYARE
jgi:hypothetical protein